MATTIWPLEKGKKKRTSDKKARRLFLHFFACVRSFSTVFALYQESPRQTKPKKGPKRKVHEFRPFLWILVFFLRKQARFTLNFCSGTPLRKVHELTFFGLVWFAGATPDSIACFCTFLLLVSDLFGRSDRFRTFRLLPLFPPFRMQVFCLQLEASCLQWSFYTYNWQF